MFLAWNYTLELFFWIILGAVILVSLTILLARPIFHSKKSETSGETLLLTGESVDSSKGKIVNQDKVFSRIEEKLEIFEENDEEEVTLYMKGKAAAIIFGYSLFSLLIFYIGLAWESRIESDPRELDKIFSFLLKCLLLTNGFTLYYGFYQNNTDVLKISGRIVAFIFFIGHENMIMSSPFETSTFFLLGLLALLFSGDLKRIWKWMTSNEEENVTQFGKWVENILKLLREKWMTINTYTGIRYLLYLFFFLSVILFLAIFSFQFS